MSLGPRKYDLTECDREPIHQLGYIQPFGAMIAVNGDWNIAHASANVAEILGTGAAVNPVLSCPTSSSSQPSKGCAIR